MSTSMVITLVEGADARVVQGELAARGLWVQRLDGGSQVHFAVEAHSAAIDRAALLDVHGVHSVSAAASAHPRLDAQPAAVRVGDTLIGPGAPRVVMGGPCSVESPAQIDEIAGRLAALGVRFLRGGAFKPRTSPYAFQGHGAEALGWLRKAADHHHMQVVTEAMGAEDVSLVAEHTDLIQIGSRNMHNYALLRTIARTGRPTLLKRGMAATVEEWLQAGEYLLVHGAASVIFCERGVRGFDPATRNLLDLGAVALLAHVYRVPVMVDPSHATGRRDLILPLARAALAAGAAGLLVETHHDPAAALSDGPQALPPEALAGIIAAAKQMEGASHV